MIKCNFCDNESVMFYLALFGHPVNNCLHWEKFKIYACNHHRLHLSAYNLDGSEISDHDK
jgi:hypothetical protein